MLWGADALRSCTCYRCRSVVLGSPVGLAGTWLGFCGFLLQCEAPVPGSMDESVVLGAGEEVCMNALCKGGSNKVRQQSP